MYSLQQKRQRIHSFEIILYSARGVPIQLYKMEVLDPEIELGLHYLLSFRWGKSYYAKENVVEKGGQCSEQNCIQVNQEYSAYCFTHFNVPRSTFMVCPNDQLLSSSHVSKKRCRMKQCTNRVTLKGLCRAHGGYKECSITQCELPVVSKGVCGKHGGGSRCKHTDGCKRFAQARGLCVSHGGKRPKKEVLGTVMNENVKM